MMWKKKSAVGSDDSEDHSEEDQVGELQHRRSRHMTLVNSHHHIVAPPLSGSQSPNTSLPRRPKKSVTEPLLPCWNGIDGGPEYTNYEVLPLGIAESELFLPHERSALLRANTEEEIPRRRRRKIRPDRVYIEQTGNQCQGDCCRAKAEVENEREERLETPNDKDMRKAEQEARRAEREVRRAEREVRRTDRELRRAEREQKRIASRSERQERRDASRIGRQERRDAREYGSREEGNTTKANAGELEGNNDGRLAMKEGTTSPSEEGDVELRPIEGNSRSRERKNGRKQSKERRNKSKGARELLKQLVEEPRPQFRTSPEDCQQALKLAARQREEVTNRILEHRLLALEEATKRRRESKARQRTADSSQAGLLDTIMEAETSQNSRRRRKERSVPVEADVERDEEAVRERERQHAARVRERQQAHAARIRQRELAREQDEARELAVTERAEAELRRHIEQENNRHRDADERAHQLRMVEDMRVSAEARALSYLRAAERERQMFLLLSPQSTYHARTNPPPRDEYSTIDEDIPPYHAQLHKYLDLVAYDERFTPVLRVNRYLISGDSELTAAIEKFTRFNLLPEQTDLWSISHVDDNDYEQMIPALIPESSYHGNELEGF